MQLYYLNSRYYSPRACRFVSADDIDIALDEYTSTLNGLNLYTYCLNNPIMFTDPTGHLAILIGIIIGAIAGFGTAVYIDYKDDGQIFNGSVAWYDYLGAIVIGGAIGAVAGYALPYINSFLNSTYSLGGTVLAGVNIPAITVSGSQIAALGVATLLGLQILFSKGSGPRFGHNQHEKQMWDEAMRRLNIKDKDLRTRLHNENHKYPYQNTLKGLVEQLKEILRKWGKL